METRHRVLSTNWGSIIIQYPVMKGSVILTLISFELSWKFVYCRW